MTQFGGTTGDEIARRQAARRARFLGYTTEQMGPVRPTFVVGRTPLDSSGAGIGTPPDGLPQFMTDGMRDMQAGSGMNPMQRAIDLRRQFSQVTQPQPEQAASPSMATPMAEMRIRQAASRGQVITDPNDLLPRSTMQDRPMGVSQPMSAPQTATPVPAMMPAQPPDMPEATVAAADPVMQQADLRRRLRDTVNQRVLAARQAQRLPGLGSRTEQIAAGQLAASEFRAEEDEIRRALAARQGLVNAERAAALTPEQRLAAATSLDTQLASAQSTMLDQSMADIERRRQLAALYPNPRTQADLAAAEADAKERERQFFQTDPFQFERAARARGEVDPMLERRRQAVSDAERPVMDRMTTEREDRAMRVEQDRQMRQAMFDAELRQLNQVGRESQPDAMFGVPRAEWDSLDTATQDGVRRSYIRTIGTQLATQDAQSNVNQVLANPTLRTALTSLSDAMSAFIGNPRSRDNMVRVERALDRMESLPEEQQMAIADAIKMTAIAENPEALDALDTPVRGTIGSAYGTYGNQLILLKNAWTWITRGDNPFTRTRDAEALRTRIMDVVGL